MTVYCVTCDQTCPGCDCAVCAQCEELDDASWLPAFLDDVPERPATTTEVVNVKGGRL